MKERESSNYNCPIAMAGRHAEPCMGSRCAVWRWVEPKFGSVETRRGYCGLGGEPKYPLNPDNERP